MSSSKVMFNLETLRAKALESMDLRIEQKTLEVQSYTDDAAQQQRVAEWRDQQEKKVSELFRQLGDDGIDNHRLSTWALDPIPEFDIYDRNRASRDLERLHGLRSQIVAKTDSLVANEDGNLSLTKTQLAEFFGL